MSAVTYNLPRETLGLTTEQIITDCARLPNAAVKKKEIRFSDWSNQCDHIRQNLDIRYYLVKLLFLTLIFH